MGAKECELLRRENISGPTNGSEKVEILEKNRGLCSLPAGNRSARSDTPQVAFLEARGSKREKIFARKVPPFQIWRVCDAAEDALSRDGAEFPEATTETAERGVSDDARSFTEAKARSLLRAFSLRRKLPASRTSPLRDRVRAIR